MNPVAREAAKSAELTPLAQQILSHIDESALVAMCCDIVTIPSATGHELAVAEYMRGQMEQLGLEITWQPIEDGRANVIGRLQGEGNGKCLMFNGHMDTSNTGDEPFLTGIGYKPRAVVKNGMIYGLGIYNMKGALICYLNAVKALLKAGLKLEGFVNIGGISGGHAWRASRTPERADLFLDVRVPPAMPMTEARKEARRFFLEIKKRYPDYGLEFETYVSVPGAGIAENHEMVRAIERNHQAVVGKPPRRSTVLWCSDASVLSRFGCDTVNYGPSSGERDAEGEKVAIQTLLDITKVYALTAAEICGAR